MQLQESNEAYEEKAKWEPQKNTISYFDQILESESRKNSACTATYLPSYKPFK